MSTHKQNPSRPCINCGHRRHRQSRTGLCTYCRWLIRRAWSVERTRELEHLLSEGLTFTAAARALGTTKGAVAGAAWRGGLCRELSDERNSTTLGRLDAADAAMTALLDEYKAARAAGRLTLPSTQETYT